NAPAPTVVTTTPTLTRSFNYSYFTIGPFTDYGVSPDSIPPPDASGFVEWFDYRFFRPPVTMTLRIVDSAHGSAATAHKITFANSDETWGAHVPSGENFAGTAYGPDFFNFDAVSFRTLSGFKPCHAHFAVPHIGVKSV